MLITVYPLHLGSITRDKSSFTYLKNIGTKADFPIISWLVEIGKTKIMIDTGTNAPEQTADYHRPLIRSKEQELPSVLKSLSVDPLDIKIVIFTHLHWDHCYNAHLFPNATFIVQRDELRYAVAPLPLHHHGYDRLPITQTEYTLVNGDKKITDGVSVIRTPGHTPGSQVVLLEGQEKRGLIAGDTIPLYENWYNGDFPLPSGVHNNLDDYYASFEKINNLNPDLILPGHEVKVFEQIKYTL